MNYIGVDIHKKYSVLCALDEGGRKLREARVEGNAWSGFAQFFAGLEGPSKAVVEACWNWGLIHDEIEEIEQVEEVVLAHPYKTRLITDAQIKTDRLDAHALGTLLRGNLVARVHVPRRETRARKNLLRQRLYWARLRAMLRNRIHALLDRQRALELPQCSDIFGVRGLGFLRRLELSEPDASLLREQLASHDLIAQQMKAQEKRIAVEFGSETMQQHLLSVPGIGPTLAAVIACEGDAIERFPTAEKLCAYAGVVPTNHPCQRWQDEARPAPALLQQMAALGLGRSELGGDRLLALFWRSVSAASRAWQKSQHRRTHRGASHVPHYLAAPA